MIKLQSVIISLGLGVSLSVPVFVLSDDHEEYAPVPEPPVLPDPVESGEALEPEITIIRRDDATITEYRVNGNLYMVKIVPAAGKPYYLIDRDGDGEMDGRMNDIYENITVPEWVLFNW